MAPSVLHADGDICSRLRVCSGTIIVHVRSDESTNNSFSSPDRSNRISFVLAHVQWTGFRCLVFVFVYPRTGCFDRLVVPSSFAVCVSDSAISNCPSHAVMLTSVLLVFSY